MKKLLCGAALALSSLAVNADNMGVTVGAYLWSTQLTEGRLSAPAYNNYNISIDAEDANNGVFYVQWKHSHAYVPNLKVSINNIKHEGTGGFIFGDSLFPITNGKVDMSHYDLTASWPIIDGSFYWDAGLMVRVLDGDTGGEIGTGSSETSISIPLSTTMPLLYTSVEVDLATGIKAGIELMGGEYDQQQMIDGNIFASYTSPSGLGINAGYRILQSDIETQAENIAVDVFANMDFKGAYAGLYFNF